MSEMKTVCQLDKCTGCMACLEVCNYGAIAVQDSLKAYNAVIDQSKCVNCNACHRICQNNAELKFNKPIGWQQGFVIDENVRKASSSGGLCAAIMQNFIDNGGFVCSCLLSEGNFIFKLTNEKADIKLFQGSKYVKSNPAGIYKSIKEKLKDSKVLFVGLPCQAEALKLYVGESLQENLYTVDLICHGTPSPQLLDKFLSQYNIKTSDCLVISFRQKSGAQVQGTVSFSPSYQQDLYSIAFLQGIDYTENCYSCKYAREERISDLTLGDSWGSGLSPEIVHYGLSLIISNTDKAKYLLRDIAINIYPADKDIAISQNHQLQNPMQKHKNRDKFFKILQTENFNKAVKGCLAKDIFKQKVKRALIKVKLYHREGIFFKVCVRGDQ